MVGMADVSVPEMERLRHMIHHFRETALFWVVWC